MSSPKPPLSLRFSSKQPITSVLKEHKGFVVNKNSSAFWAASFWGDLMRRDEEVRGSTVFEVPESRLNVFGLHNLWAAKEDSNAAVAETEDDTQVAKSNFHKTTGSSSDGPSRKIDRMIVGTSICAVVVIFCFVLPKQQALRGIAVPEHLFRSMEKILYGFLYSHPLRRHLSSISMENFMFYSAPVWLSFLFTCYQYSVNRNIGKMGSKKLINIQSVTFDDVEGCDAAKTALLEAVLCMNGDTNYSKVGAEAPKGVLLVGPPGTGKTLLARAVAGEAGVPFFSICASEFVEVYVGAGAARVRELFRDARKHSPSIIYIDEIDAVGGDRGNSFNSERDHTLNQLLAEIDGFEKDENVLVIAATNRAELLDPALTRAGRFSSKVFVGKPDEEGRRKIFGLYLEKVPMKEDKQVICRLVASRTRGLVGADLENIAKDSRLLAGRRGGGFVTKEDVLQAVGMAKTKFRKDDVNICCIL